MSVIPALWRLNQEDLEFKTSMVYIASQKNNTCNRISVIQNALYTLTKKNGV
jgi:hypothetical protein